jgi:exocyst complex component 4
LDHYIHSFIIVKELKLELKLKNAKEIKTDDLLLDRKKLIALGRLYQSLVCTGFPTADFALISLIIQILQKWFVRKIWDLRTPSKTLIQPATINAVEHQLQNTQGSYLNESSTAFVSRRWSYAGVQTKPEAGLEGNIHLPLKDETAS